MDLYLLRHANAGTGHANPRVDTKRPLDKEGVQQCLLIGSYLSALKVQFDLIVSSPLKRALQTASLIGTELGYDAKIHVTDVLAPSGVAPEFLKLVSQLSSQENVLVVGHKPNLALFLGALISPSHRLNVRMRKGALARVDCSRRPGQLIWLVEPRILRQVYASVARSSQRKTS
jgi:phosphohistidine phosphatase